MQTLYLNPLDMRSFCRVYMHDIHTNPLEMRNFSKILMQDNLHKCRLSMQTLHLNPLDIRSFMRGLLFKKHFDLYFIFCSKLHDQEKSTK